MAWYNSWFGRTKDNNKHVVVQQPQSMFDIQALNAIVDNQSLLNKRNRELINAGFAFDTSTIDLASVESSSGLFGIIADKPTKNMVNWRLSMAPEVKWCLDEIFSEIADVKLQLIPEIGYSELSDTDKKLVDQEFLRFVSLFNFNNLTLIDDFRHLLIEGEIAYEAVKSEKHPESGIIGIRRLYSDDFNVVYSPIITNGFAINVDLDRVFNRYGMNAANSLSSGSKFIYNSKTGEFETDPRHAALSFPNVVYVCYDKLPNVNQPISLLDYVHKPFFELNTIQQAAIVMRIVRSPERLLFNVDVGGLSNKAAEAHLQKLANKLRNRKVAIPTGMNENGQMNVAASQTANMPTMLESYIFGKSSANGGTTVSTIGSTANFDQINDINYFHDRLLRIFKIPFARISEPANKQYQPSQQLTYDEVRFYKFIVSIEERFNIALTNMFLENLRLRGIGNGKITNTNISLAFETPARYSVFLNTAAEKAKLDMYEAYASHEEFNKGILAKKYLGMLDDDIEAHKEANRKNAKEQKEYEKNNGEDSSFEDRAFNSDSEGGLENFNEEPQLSPEEDFGAEEIPPSEEPV